MHTYIQWKLRVYIILVVRFVAACRLDGPQFKL